jgi:hypothetical protein
MSIHELKHIGGGRSKNFSTKRIASMETVGEGAHGPIVVDFPTTKLVAMETGRWCSMNAAVNKSSKADVESAAIASMIS